MVQKRKIELDKETREQMITEIMTYFRTERDEDLGQLASGMFLDFIIDRLAPEFYNQGVMDSYQYLNERIEDVQSLLI